MNIIDKSTKNYNVVVYNDPNIEHGQKFYLMTIFDFNNGKQYNKYLQINYNALYKILNIILENEEVIKYFISQPKIITELNLHKIDLWKIIK